LTTSDIGQSVNSAVHHAFINQLGALVNTLQNFLDQTPEGTMLQQPNRVLSYSCVLGYKGPQISQQSPLIPKYYVVKDVDPKLFVPNQDNIPQVYHIAADSRCNTQDGISPSMRLSTRWHHTSRTSTTRLELSTRPTKL
jgi:hypothetical protein